jgi:hypothetical protein
MEAFLVAQNKLFRNMAFYIFIKDFLLVAEEEF